MRFSSAATCTGVNVTIDTLDSCCVPLPFLDVGWPSCCLERVGTGTLRSANITARYTMYCKRPTGRVSLIFDYWASVTFFGSESGR